MPLPRSTITSPGWVPGATRDLRLAASVGTATLAPSAASGPAMSSAVTRSSPSR